MKLGAMLFLPKKELIFAVIGVGLRPREKSAQPAETCAMAHVLLSQNTGDLHRNNPFVKL
jgi:hypothetical protein